MKNVEKIATEILSARTIGVKFKNLVKKLVLQENARGSGNPYYVLEAVKEKLPQEVFDSWEGAYSEIERLVFDTNMSGVHKDLGR